MLMNIRYRNIALVAFLLLFCPTATVLARQWTLRQCIDHALEYNIGIRQKDNACRQQQLSLSTARNSRLPSLDASMGQNFSFGRSLTADNTYTNTNTSSTSMSIGTSIPLFTGMNIPNTIRLNRLNLEATMADLEKAKNDIRMQVAQAYVEILYDMEIADVARRQIEIDSMQVARLQAMLDEGKTSEVELAQQKATLAQSCLTATQADNNLRMALLTLSQLLELPTDEGFSVVRPSEEELREAFKAGETAAPDAVYAEAVGIKPEIKAEQLRLMGMERSIDIARSALYPQLSLSAGLGTNYYRSSGFHADGFSDQLKNNFSQYVGVNLSIPIFNRFRTRNDIRAAKLNRDAQQLTLENTKKALYKEIQQVCCNAVAAESKCNSSRQAAAGNEAAFMLVKAKYENGKAGITEFNEAKNNWLKAESELVQARYEYLYQTALLDFYRGRDLDF